MQAHPTRTTLNETFLSFNQAPKAALVRRTTYAKNVGNTQRSAPAVLGSSRPEVLTTRICGNSICEMRSGLPAEIRSAQASRGWINRRVRIAGKSTGTTQPQAMRSVQPDSWGSLTQSFGCIKGNNLTRYHTPTRIYLSPNDSRSAYTFEGKTHKATMSDWATRDRECKQETTRFFDV